MHEQVRELTGRAFLQQAEFHFNELRIGPNSRRAATGYSALPPLTQPITTNNKTYYYLSYYYKNK